MQIYQLESATSPRKRASSVKTVLLYGSETWKMTISAKK